MAERFFREKILPVLLFLVYQALRCTWKIQVHESASLRQSLQTKQTKIFAHWHGDELGILHLLGRYHACAMTSTSRDGELMDRILWLFGAETSRGSSTRGGASALRGIVRLARQGWNPSIAVDGPKGPLHKVKPGVFEISRWTNGLIFPLVVVCNRKHVFEKSWNKSFLPLPFARLVIVWGDALPLVPSDGDSRSPELAKTLENALNNAKHQASVLIAAL